MGFGPDTGHRPDPPPLYNTAMYCTIYLKSQGLGCGRMI